MFSAANRPDIKACNYLLTQLEEKQIVKSEKNKKRYW